MYKSIVTGTDGSQTADAAMGRALELARAFGAEIHLVNVARKAPALASMDYEHGGAVVAAEYEGQQAEWASSSVGKLQSALQAEGLPVTGHAMQGNPSEAILQVAANVGADLIVVGSRGMRGAGRLVGSVPNTLSHRAPCDVLIVRTV